MEIQTEINQLRRRLKELEVKQELCHHKWEAPFQDSIEEIEFVYGNKPMGSDYFNPTIEGSRKVNVLVWKRQCLICGKTETTKKTKAKYVGEEPEF